jgi:tyrosinase
MSHADMDRRSVLIAAASLTAAIMMAAIAACARGGNRPAGSSTPTAPPLRVRRSIQELQDQYTAGNKKPLEDLWRAWAKIKELPPGDPRSFFTLGGYHGEPFRGPGSTDPQYWGGYCHHGNVLFPTWHRVYLHKVEEALRSVPGCEDVTLPYWDETSADSLANGIPWALTRQNVELDGKTIPNPLRSFIFTADVVDSIGGQGSIYSKPKGYETVRYPLSGLVGTQEYRDKTAAHNAQYPDYEHNVELLNQNITTWLAGTVNVEGKPIGGQLADMYRACLDAPNYTVFSNNTSCAQWNKDTNAKPPVVSLELPHDGIHAAIGGFDLPSMPGIRGHDVSPIAGANADMGENDTDALDPIFFLHHCYVDRLFWLWQKRHGFQMDIMAGYPGTDPWKNPQGPTPELDPNKPLDLHTPLRPFTKADGEPYTSLDCINIETQLGFTYSTGSLGEEPPHQPEQAPSSTAPAPAPANVVVVSGIDRARYRGSFLVSIFGDVNGSRVHLGTQAVLSRWNVENCANCQTHLEAQAYFGVPPAGTGVLAGATRGALGETSTYDVDIRTRDGVQPQPAETNQQQQFRLEVR